MARYYYDVSGLSRVIDSLHFIKWLSFTRRYGPDFVTYKKTRWRAVCLVEWVNMKKQKVKMYYTPQDIIDYIEGDRVAHPSAGSGGFLKQAADKLKDGKFDLIQNPHIPIKMKYKLLLALALLIILACGGTSAAGPTPTVQENAWYACTTFIERQLNLPSGDAQDYNPAGVTTLQAGQFQVDVYYAKEGNTYRCQITHRADGNWQLDGLLAR